MFLAYASAARSAQMGRQVGASIATDQGEVMSLGFNEVPSKRGGTYWDGDREDHRDHKEGKDSNYENRKRIVDSVLAGLHDKITSESKLEEIVRITLECAQSGDLEPDLLWPYRNGRNGSVSDSFFR